MFTIKLILFVVGTILIIWGSRSSLREPTSHGFYRFFAWESILILFIFNVNYWIVAPFSFRQMIAWTLLLISLLLILQGIRLFRQKGNIDHNRDDPALAGIEKTTTLITTGLYGYIRHPFYSSLLFLAWGIFFKHPGWIGIALGTLITLCLVKTAKIEEQENIEYFGESYREYMKQTKMFIPFVF